MPPRQLTIKEYREKHPEYSKGKSDYDLTYKVWNTRHKDKEDFDSFSKRFNGVPSTPEEKAVRSPVDRSPRPQPAIPATGPNNGTDIGHISYMGNKTMGAWNAGWAGIAQGLDDVSDMFTQTFFGENSTVFENLADELYKNAEYYDEIAKNHDAGFAEEVLAEAIGGGVPGILEFAGNVPWAVLREYAAGVKDPNINGVDVVKNAVVQGAKRYVLGRIFGAFGQYGKPAAMAGNSVVFSAETALEGGNTRDIAKAGATGVLYGLLHKKNVKDGKKRSDAKAELDKLPVDETLPEPTKEEQHIVDNPLTLNKPSAEALTDRRVAPREEGKDRRDSEKRKKLSEEYTHEELVQMRKTDELTNHPNAVAFDEAPKKAVQAVSDINNQKWYNDNYGWKAGDAIIKAKAEALREAGLEKDSFRLHGDEFGIQADTDVELDTKLKKAQEILAKKEIVVTDKDGNEFVLTGVRFTYGKGVDVELTNEAGAKIKKTGQEVAMDDFNARKKAESEAGLRVSREGKPVGLQVRPLKEGKPKDPTAKDARFDITEQELRKHIDADSEAIAEEISSQLDADGNFIGEFQRSKENNLRIERWSLTDGGKAIVDAVSVKLANKIQKKTGIRRSLADIEKSAMQIMEELAVENPQAVLKRAKKHGKAVENIEAEQRALMSLVAVHAEKADYYLARSESPTGTNLDTHMFMLHINFLAELQPLVAGAQAHIARATTAARITISGREVSLMELTPEKVEASMEAKTALASLMDSPDYKRQVERARSEWKKRKTTKERMKFAKQQRGGKFINALLEWRATNMLTSIKTQVVNFNSNFAHLILDTVDNYAAVATSAFSKGEKMTLQEAHLRASATWAGIMKGFTLDPFKEIKAANFKGPDKLKRFEKYVEGRGIDPYLRQEAEGIHKAISEEYLRDSQVGKILDTVTGHSTISDVSWKLLSTWGNLSRALSFGLMNLSDSTFKNIAYDAEVVGLWTKEAIKRGVPRENVAKWVTEKSALQEAYRKGVKGLVEGLTEADNMLFNEIHNEAIKKARYITWQNEMAPGAQTRIEQALKESPILRLMIPFYKTPMNLLRQIPKRVPGLNLLSAEWMADIKAGGRRRAMALARLSTGTAMTMFFFGLVRSGLVTGNIDQREAETARLAGIQPYSIRIPGTKQLLQYNRYDPFGMILGMVADADNAAARWKDEDFEGLFASIALIMGNNVINKTWATTIQDLALLFREPDRYGDSFVKRYASTLLPLSGLAKSSQEYLTVNVKDTYEWWNMVKATYAPWAAPDRLDDLGRPITRDKRPLFGSARSILQTDSPARMEMAYLHISGVPRLKKIFDIEISTEQEREIFRIAREEIKIEEKLNRFVNGASYKNMPTDMRRKELAGLRNTLLRAAVNKYFGKTVELRKEYREKTKADILEMKNRKDQRPAGDKPDLRETLLGGRKK